MSDIFDHGLDAYEDLGSYYAGDREGWPEGSWSAPDPLYYHTKVVFEKIVAETEKAYLIHESQFNQEVWVPKSICRELNLKDNTVYCHRAIYYSILKKKAEEIYGQDTSSR